MNRDLAIRLAAVTDADVQPSAREPDSFIVIVDNPQRLIATLIRDAGHLTDDEGASLYDGVNIRVGLHGGKTVLY